MSNKLITKIYIVGLKLLDLRENTIHNRFLSYLSRFLLQNSLSGKVFCLRPVEYLNLIKATKKQGNKINEDKYEFKIDLIVKLI